MTNLPIDLALKTMTAKVSVGAHDRLTQLAEKLGAKKQDVLSACLLHMDEEKLAKILHHQSVSLAKLPKPVRNMLRDVEKLSDADRAMIKKIMG